MSKYDSYMSEYRFSDYLVKFFDFISVLTLRVDGVVFVPYVFD